MRAVWAHRACCVSVGSAAAVGAAQKDYRESLTMFRKLGGVQQAEACLQGLSRLMLCEGDPAGAGDCFGNAAHLEAAAGRFDNASQFMRNKAVLLKDFDLAAAKDALLDALM